MVTTFKIRRCLKGDLPPEGGLIGEMRYCNDTDELVIGEGIGNPWTVFASKAISDWVGNKSYTAGSVVISVDKIYRCLTTHTSSASFDSDLSHWYLLIGGSGGGPSEALSTTGGTMTGDLVMADGTAIVPATPEGATLGTAEKPFKDIFVGAHSIYVDGNKVIDSTNTTINVTTTVDQHLAVSTSGLGTTRLASSKEIILYSGGDINHQALGDFEILSKGRVATITDVDGQDIIFETQGVLSNINFKSKHEINFEAPVVDFATTPTVNGVPIGGNTYVHPATHPAAMITEDTSHRFVTDLEIATWNDKYTRVETDTRIQAIVGAAPSALDTLKEISTALSNDANFATTITNQLALKENLANKGVANGYAGLGADGKVPAAQLPVYTAPVTRVNLKTGDVTLTASDVGAAPTGHTHTKDQISDLVNATTFVSGLFSSTDKTKLDGIAANATNYVHPTGDGNQHVPATSTTNNGKVLKAGATAGSAAWGTLTADEVGAAATSHTHTKAQITDLADATTTVSGTMSAADKVKLNGIATGATAYVHPSTDGSLHVPATSTTNNGKVLKAGASAGVMAWGTLTAAEVGAAATSHTHTKAQVTDFAHTHPYSEISGGIATDQSFAIVFNNALANAISAKYVLPRAVTIKEIRVVSDAAPSAATTLTFYKAGVSMGTMSLTTADQTAAYSVTANVGDIFHVVVGTTSGINLRVVSINVKIVSI